jgi:hypothetical protein
MEGEAVVEDEVPHLHEGEALHLHEGEAPHLHEGEGAAARTTTTMPQVEMPATNAVNLATLLITVLMDSKTCNSKGDNFQRACTRRMYKRIYH